MSMDIDCPRCKAAIPLNLVKPEFNCPYCCALLVEKSFRPIMAGMLAWLAGFLALVHFWPAADGHASVFRIVVFVALGWACLRLMFRLGRRIELRSF